MATDWLMFRDEYLRTPVSLTELARERGVSASALKRLAAKEGWAALKRGADPADWQPMQEAYLNGAISLKTLAREKGVSLTRLRAVAAREGWAALNRAGELIRAADAGMAAAQADAAAKQPPEAPPRPEVRQEARELPDAGSDAPKQTATATAAFRNGDRDNPDVCAVDEPAADSATADGKEQRAPAEPGKADGPDAAANRLARLAAIGDQLTDQLARAAGELDKQVVLRKTRTREMVYEDPEGRGKPVEETVEENVEVKIVDATVSCAGLQKLSASLKYLREATRADAGDGRSVDMVAELMKRLDDEAAQEDGHFPGPPEDEPDSGHAYTAGALPADACEEDQADDRRSVEADAMARTDGG